ncbi:MAG: hypothetical protein ABSF44_08505 [Candidatus Bathyarchaeia archaeon]
MSQPTLLRGFTPSQLFVLKAVWKIGIEAETIGQNSYNIITILLNKASAILVPFGLGCDVSATDAMAVLAKVVALFRLGWHTVRLIETYLCCEL